MEKRDFFISYTKTDKTWAVWIAKILKSNGYTVYIQALDIKPGDNFVEKMEEFLENSDNFIAIWSEHYFESQFCMNELRVAFSEYNNGRTNCLLPVRIDGYPIKRLYSTLVRVELPDMGAKSQERLMDAVCSAVPSSLTTDMDADTLYQYGEDYYYGENGVKRDYAVALQYYEKAAGKGHADALNDLAFLYHYGRGAKQDYAKARTYYEQAAKKGQLDALYNLGLLYEYGRDVPIDYMKAREYYTQAAQKGHSTALFSLACLYEDGRGVKKDYAKALEYYQKAADAGDENAPLKVAELRKKMNSKK